VRKHNQGGQKEWYLAIDGLNQLHFTIYDSRPGQYAGVAGYLFGVYTVDMHAYLNQWLYVAGTYDGSGSDAGIHLYLNGVSVKDYSETRGEYIAMAPHGSPVYIGHGYCWAPFNGMMDEVRVSSKVRSQAEITAAWNNGNGRSFEVDGDTVALWHMDEGEGSIIYDESANDNDASITGASWVDRDGADLVDKSVNEGELLQFTISASDPDGDSLIYSASNLPQGASFDPDTQTFSWTPDYGQSGVYPNIRFEVSDGELELIKLDKKLWKSIQCLNNGITRMKLDIPGVK